MACLEEAVGSILSGVREVKIEITVIDGRRGEILVRGGQFFSGVYLGAPHESDSRGCFFTMRRIYVGFRVEISAFAQRTASTPVISIAMVL